jgi:hypothetical protein
VQLDKTRIAIRERSFPDIMDLALKVCRGHAQPLLITTLVGTIPAVLFNHWVLSEWLDGLESYSELSEAIFAYLWFTLWWVVFEIPLVAAPTTLYLGQALFVERPSVRRMIADFWRSLPQLLVFQVLLRGILTFFVVTWFVLFIVWPYLNEILLLERNPLLAGRKGSVSTMGRANAMHGRNIGELFGRWLASAFLGTLLILSMWLSAWVMRGFLFQQWDLDPTIFSVWFQVALWSVLGYFTVVRYLSYLDLRIRTEGWEVELVMRAEGERLSRQLA